MSASRARPAARPARDAIARWLTYEQTVNERILNERAHSPIDERSNTVDPRFRPEARPIWPLDLVWLPAAQARVYGFAGRALRAALGLRAPAGRSALFVHPQSRGLYRERIAEHGLGPSRVAVTPTASYRALLARGRGARAAVLKVSLGATIGRTRRALGEDEIARGLLVNLVLETIPAAVRRRLRFAWFPEHAGVVDARARHGWLLRALPPALRARSRTTLVPAFSLISRRAGDVPLLVQLIRRSGQAPELYVAQRLLLPYVNVLAYLLLHEGVDIAGHGQNVLYEIDGQDEPTGRLVLRDLADASVNVALRIARRRPLPLPPAGFFPARAGFAFTTNAADFHRDRSRPRGRRAGETVHRHGLASFVWSINESLRRYFVGYAAAQVERTYLRLWQQAASGYCGLTPAIQTARGGGDDGIAIDTVIARFLARSDWSRLAAAGRVALPAAAVPVGRSRRRRGRDYLRIPCAWGALYADDNGPAFFTPAF